MNSIHLPPPTADLQFLSHAVPWHSFHPRYSISGTFGLQKEDGNPFWRMEIPVEVSAYSKHMFLFILKRYDH